ncbi:zinc metalloprotease [Tellurirhabdus rosea]|uniref:zinc metalloprotease n=1 Tax=Tellurirhabdus rosea TaxID=2674997 RepID=UPI0022536375|nr:zinc metalloprotease [Tellurirhabdus rosea]
MKKIFTLAAFFGLAYGASSCFEPSIEESVADGHIHSAARIGDEDDDHKKDRSCATMEVLAEKLQEDPELAEKLKEIDKHADKFASKNGRISAAAAYTGTVTIPVVINIIYNSAKPQENISDAQIASQMNVLNADFNATNADRGQTPSAFAAAINGSGFDVQFTLSKVVRKASTKTSWGTRDAMKKSRNGGIEPTDPARNLNIWVCNIGGGILGYAQFPGGNLSTDGVVISPQYFGTTGYVAAPFNKGRTATHEVGHWLNLRHIWGDGGCGIDDYVSDTPDSDAPNYGCPAFPTVKCGNTLMTMNYMDYTDDACMYMFTNGQKARSRALFNSGGARSSFVPVQ